MDWLSELLEREDTLKQQLSEISQDQGAAEDGELFNRLIRPKIEEIQASIDDYLCGRNVSECARMNYEVCLKLPIFSHLKNIFSPASLVR